jgi:hypothetical protein
MDHKFASLAQSLAEDEEMSVILFCNLDNKLFHVVTSFAAEKCTTICSRPRSSCQSPLGSAVAQNLSKGNKCHLLYGTPLGITEGHTLVFKHTKAN